MLIIDFHTLCTVNRLGFVHDVILNGSRALNSQDVVRGDSTVRERYTGTYIVTFLYQDLLGEGDEVRLLFAKTRGDEDFLVTTFDFTELNYAINLSNDSWVRRVTCLKELCNTWQTTGNIGCCTGYARLRIEGVTDLNLCTINVREERLNRQVVRTDDIARLVKDIRLRHFGLVFGIGDINLFNTGSIDLGLSSNTFDNILVLDSTGLLNDECRNTAIPITDNGIFRINLTNLYVHSGSVRDIE